MSDKLRDQINELIRDEIQEVINDYVDAQEETQKAGLGFVGKEDEKEVRVSDSVRHAQAQGLARRIQCAAKLRTRHRA